MSGFDGSDLGPGRGRCSGGALGWTQTPLCLPSRSSSGQGGLEDADAGRRSLIQMLALVWAAFMGMLSLTSSRTLWRKHHISLSRWSFRGAKRLVSGFQREHRTSYTISEASAK